MNKYTTPLYKLYDKVIDLIASTRFDKIRAIFNHGKYYDLTPEDHATIKEMLAKNYYIILTRRKTHLTTYFIGFASLVKTGKVSKWTHALMNMEGDDPVADTDFKLMEATGSGVHFSDFMQVFDCDWVVLMKPKFVTVNEWTEIFDKMVKQNGKDYDDLFDLADDSHLSCVELCRVSLQAMPDYDTKFKAFEDLIKKNGNLTPQMYYDCSDCFEIVWEVRR